VGEGIEADLALTLGALTLRVDLRTEARRVALIGPSGAGKTTVLRILAGVEARATGRLAVGGEVWQDRTTFVPPHRRRVGWVPQDGALFPHLSVRQNLGYAGASARAVAEVADRLGVGGVLDRGPRNLSGGERQRVALGRALLAEPRLLLLDEPFAALDEDLRARLAGELRALCAERALPYVVVSHHRDDVAALADEIWAVRDGAVYSPK
jgi:molybdate transport system ATP-binding protein